ncbi:MAG: DUF1501 domain-containing protein [Pirellulaceae bacterium]
MRFHQANQRSVLRRDFVRMGFLGSVGLFQATRRAAADTPSAVISNVANKVAPAKSCILIWLDGGPSHLDLFDPKPQAPVEVRGPFGSIRTKIPGVYFSELLPQTAKIADKLAVVRSMTSPLGEHNFGTHYLLTGYRPTPAVPYPAISSVANHLLSSSADLPSNIAVPHHRVGGANFAPQGFLPNSVAPFEINADPADADFHVQHLSPFLDVTPARLQRRRSILRQMDAHQAAFEQANSTSQPRHDVFEQAFRMAVSTNAKSAFDLDQETADVRNRYGRKSIGQCCLLARRLIERGVRFVTVNNTGWDTHANLVTRLQEGFTGAKTPVGLGPSLDQAFATLITDLEDRNLLDETLVVVMGEFGRTPKLNTEGGRDHWPRVFSVVLAGAGISGQVIGASDDHGESPADRPVTPADLAATIYRLLGVDLNTVLHTPDGRPIRISNHGQPLPEIFS